MPFDNEGPDDLAIRDRVTEEQQAMIDAASTSRKCVPSDLSAGVTVLLKQQRENKLSASFQTDPFTVVDRVGDQATIASRDGVTKKRHVADLKRYHQPSDPSPRSVTSDVPVNATVSPLPVPRPAAERELRRSSRERRPPQYLADFDC